MEILCRVPLILC